MSAPETLTRPARGRRHPMTVVTRARELRRIGYEAAEIVTELGRDGVAVDITSIKRWTDPKVARRMSSHDMQRTARKARANGSKPMGPHHARPEYKLSRMLALRERGMTNAMIAIAMDFDFGDRLSEDQVRYALRHLSYPKNPTKREHVTRGGDLVTSTPCAGCGRAIAYAGRGRPRKFCGSCESD